MKRALLATSVSLWSGLALAGGFEYPDIGTVAMGRGAAFAAKADDGTAIYYNPAGLADQDDWRVMVDLTMGYQQTSFTRMDPSGQDNPTATFSQISNTPGLFFIPFASVSRGFNLGMFGKLGVAVGLYAPPGNGGLSFPDEATPVLNAAQKLQVLSTCTNPPAATGCPGASTSSLTSGNAQKYMLINENLLVLYPTISAAWQPIPLVSVGASLQLLVATSAIRQATFDAASLEGGMHNPNSEQATYDTIANISVAGVTWGGNFGVKLRPIQGLSIGASYKPKATLTQSGNLTLDFSPLAQSLSAKVSNANNTATNSTDGSTGTGPTTLQNAFPGELKTGIDYDFGPFDLEADFDWTQWSQYQSAVLTPSFNEQSAASPSSAVAQSVITRDFQDTWSLRIGGEGKLPLGPLRAKVRAGVGYESSMYNPNATQYVTIDYANFEQWWGAIGATVGVGPFDFDLTYSHVYMPTKTVTNSGVVAQENNASGIQPFVVGDGTFNTSYDLIALGARAHF